MVLKGDGSLSEKVTGDGFVSEKVTGDGSVSQKRSAFVTQARPLSPFVTQARPLSPPRPLQLTYRTAANPFSRSAMMSSICSVPMERRIVFG